jgi:hypothetical protein
VPTSTLETAAAAAACDTFELNVPAQSPNRRILWTGGVSAGVHLLLLVTIGTVALESRRPSSAPELRVYLEMRDHGRDEEHERAGPTRAPAAPAAAAREELLSAATPSHSSSVRSHPRTLARTAPAAPVTPPATRSEERSAEGESSSEAPAVVTTTGASDSEAPASAAPVAELPAPVAPAAPVAELAATVAPAVPAVPAAPVAEPPAIDIPAAQQSLLTRWVMQAAEKLKDMNLRQGRLSLQHEGRQYTASFERRPAADAMDIDRVKVEITTEENGKRLRTRLELKRLAFSHFAQLVDWWDPDVQFHDDQIVGRFHSNSRINVGYDRSVAPRFLAVVTTAGAPGFSLGMTEGYRPRDEIFRGGLQTRAGRIALPETPSLPASEPDSGNMETRLFTRDTRITFYGDGSYGWRELGNEGPEHKQVMGTPAFIFGGRTLCVRGTVRGKVLVYSPDRIVIESNLTYAHDPRGADADDYLGLVSGEDIEIAPPRVTGRGDLQIQAAVYARRRFVVTDEEAPRSGTLLIYGSLTAGSLSATEPRYATHYQFDPRFEQERPPGFPMTDRYEVESWDPEWQETGDEPARELAGAAAPSSG